MSYYAPMHGIGAAFSAATKVVEDPCLTPVAMMVLRLNELEQERKPTPALPPGAPKPPPSAPAKGIGLCYAVRPLEAVLWVRERPWVLPLGAISIVGALVGLGYVIGRR